MQQEVPLPELGSNEDSSLRWNTLPRGQPSAPALALHDEQSRDLRAPITSRPVSLRSDSGMRARRGTEPDGDSNDFEQSIRSPIARPVLLGGACLVAVGMIVLSLVFKPRPEATPARALQAPIATSVARTVGQASPLPGSPAQPARALPHSPDPSAPEHTEEAAPRRAAEAPPARAGSVAPVATPAVTEDGERGGATQQSAAALYLKGQYKEALAEYRLLASAYPEQKAYGEFARILKRKLFDTCVRTQPNRREQCKQL